MLSSRKLITLSISQKLELIKEIEIDGKTRKEVAAKYGVAVSTISRILKEQNKFQQIARENGNVSKKRIKKGNFEEVEAAISIWFKQVRCKGCPISGPMILEQAKKFAVRLNIDFEPNPGWLSRWKTKNNVHFYKIQGEKLAVDQSSATHWLENILPDFLNRYEEQDIFNADESALFYRAAPSGTMAYRGEKPSGGKVQKSRITLLFISNMDGSDGEIISIGQFKQPRCCRGKEIPIKYYHNTKAWMTQDIWCNIIKDFNSEMKKKKRKVILFIDNAACHKLPENYTPSNVEIVFLPANTTALIQPLDQGIIKTFKVVTEFKDWLWMHRQHRKKLIHPPLLKHQGRTKFSKIGEL